MILEGQTSGAGAEVESDKKTLRSVSLTRGVGFSLAAGSGIIAAALAQNSTVFAMRLSPSTTLRAFFEKLRFQLTTLTAFTTPITAARAIALYRGAGAGTSGGTSFATAKAKDSAGATSQFDTANGGAISVATTAALTVAGITFETDPIGYCHLSHVGAAGGYMDWILDYSPSKNSPLILQPGQVLALRNPVLMDAAGTFQVAVTADWAEAAAIL